MSITDDLADRLGRINRAFNAMPYGGLARFTHFDTTGRSLRPRATAVSTAEEALDVVADNLERLAAVLRTAAETNEADRQALDEIRSWIGGARDLAGAIMAATETVPTA